MNKKQGILLWTAPVLLPFFVLGFMLAYVPNRAFASRTYQPPRNSGGTITYGFAQFPPSTNPWFNAFTVGLAVQDALWARPVVLNSQGEYVPDQLTEVPTVQNGDVSQDRLTVIMKLRPDLTWSDGQPIRADDFVYWEQTELDPNTNAAFISGYNQITSIVAVNDHTVQLSYAHPYGPYLQYLPLAAPRHAWGSIPDNQLASTQAVNLVPQVDSGPFMISAFLAGQSFTMVPNPHYTSSTFHKSALDQLIFKAYPTAAALITAYQTGQVQHAEGFTPQDLSQLNDVPGLHLAQDITFEYLTLNLATPVLSDVNVRKAIAQAIDRCQLIEQALQEPCNSLRVRGVLPEPSPAFDPGISFPGFNLSQARKDLLAAGWDCSTNPCTKNNQPFPTLTLVTTANRPARTRASQFIQQALAALGISVTLQFYPAGTLFADFNHNGILATGQFDLAIFADSLNFDPDDLSQITQSDQIPSATNFGSNFGRISDPQLDALFAQGRSTIDQQQRPRIYKQAEGIIADQVYLLPLNRYPNATLTSSQIVNYEDNITAVGNEWNVGDWWLQG